MTSSTCYKVLELLRVACSTTICTRSQIQKASQRVYGDNRYKLLEALDWNCIVQIRSEGVLVRLTGVGNTYGGVELSYLTSDSIIVTNGR